MQKINTLLAKKYRYQLQYFHALEIIVEHWGGLVNHLVDQIQPVDIQKNQLIVECNNPMWVSEIAYFTETLLAGIHSIFKEKKMKLRLDGIKPVFNASFIPQAKSNESVVIPKGFEKRIEWHIKNKKKQGAVLCESCQKVWDFQKICQLCSLTQI